VDERDECAYRIYAHPRLDAPVRATRARTRPRIVLIGNQRNPPHRVPNHPGANRDRVDVSPSARLIRCVLAHARDFLDYRRAAASRRAPKNGRSPLSSARNG